MDLKQRILDYTSRKATLEELETDLANQIKSVLDAEIPKLKLPDGYAFDDGYDVVMRPKYNGKPVAVLRPPHRNGVVSGKEEL